jgi:hypothetical protein
MYVASISSFTWMSGCSAKHQQLKLRADVVVSCPWKPERIPYSTSSSRRQVAGGANVLHILVLRTRGLNMLLIKPVFVRNVYLVFLFNFVLTLLRKYKRKATKFTQDSGNEMLYLSNWWAVKKTQQIFNQQQLNALGYQFFVCLSGVVLSP